MSVGERDTDARRFRDLPKTPPRVLSRSFPSPSLSRKRALLQKLTEDHEGEKVALLAQLRLPLATRSKRIPPDKSILLLAPQSLPCAPGERTDVPGSQYTRLAWQNDAAILAEEQKYPLWFISSL